MTTGNIIKTKIIRMKKGKPYNVNHRYNNSDSIKCSTWCRQPLPESANADSATSRDNYMD